MTVYVDHEPVAARDGDSVAAVLLLSKGVDYRCSQVDSTPRAPWCMIGKCCECLVEVDGQPNRQGCLVQVTEGMRIKRQYDRPTVAE